MSNGIQENELASEEPGINTITHLQNYINEKIDSLRAELQQSNDATSTQTVETGKTESEMILYLSSEISCAKNYENDRKSSKGARLRYKKSSKSSILKTRRIDKPHTLSTART